MIWRQQLKIMIFKLFSPISWKYFVLVIIVYVRLWISKSFFSNYRSMMFSLNVSISTHLTSSKSQVVNLRINLIPLQYSVKIMPCSSGKSLIAGVNIDPQIQKCPHYIRYWDQAFKINSTQKIWIHGIFSSI